ncbi:hypothetical protein [Sandaracinus amylolyticus]|uniref:hypothetical protein n=1 Tax=Sandaracinus amylolyticus TaxID=927083 RepID=UPI0012EE37B3|nr:hypothetical protein [Sandaracinus amylolyticus]
MATEQESEREPVVLEAWRARLCARGLRDAYDRMRRAMLGGELDLKQALAIAQSMDAAVDMLRETTKRLAPGSDLRRAAEETMAAFVEWRVASPRTDVSRRAAARFGARVIALEEAAKRASHGETASGAPDAPSSEPIEADETPIDARELERASRERIAMREKDVAAESAPPAKREPEPRRGPRERPSAPASSSRRRGRSRDRA